MSSSLLCFLTLPGQNNIQLNKPKHLELREGKSLFPLLKQKPNQNQNNQINKSTFLGKKKKNYISRIFTARNKPVIWLKDRNKKPWETWNQCISPSSATEGGIKRLVAAYIQTILAFSILLLGNFDCWRKGRKCSHRWSQCTMSLT